MTKLLLITLLVLIGFIGLYFMLNWEAEESPDDAKSESSKASRPLQDRAAAISETDARQTATLASPATDAMSASRPSFDQGLAASAAASEETVRADAVAIANATERQQTPEELRNEVLDTIDVALAAANSADQTAADSVSRSETITKQILELIELVGPSGAVQLEIYADSEHALAVSELLSYTGEAGASKLDGQLVITLTSTAGSWHITDFDFEDADGAAGEIDRFLTDYSEAIHLLAPN